MITIPEEEYHRRNPRGHWFDGHEAQFLESQTHEFLWDGDDLLFISSERLPGGPRRYAVRLMNAVGAITGDPSEFATRSQAVAAMKRRAKTGKETQP